MSVIRMAARIGGAAAAALLGLHPGNAQAGIDIGTFTGVITDGIDQNNNFGFGVNADLAGLTVTGNFYYNTSAGYTVGSELGTFGPIFPPVIFAEVFVGGSVNPVATYSDDNGDVSFGGNNLFVLQGDDYDSGYADTVTLEIGTAGPAFTGSGLDQGFNLTNPAIGVGSFSLTIGDFGGPTTQADFTIASANRNDVPEPASAALLAAGLTGLMVVPRRRAGAPPVQLRATPRTAPRLHLSAWTGVRSCAQSEAERS